MNAHFQNGNFDAPFAVVCVNAEYSFNAVEYPLGWPVAELP